MLFKKKKDIDPHTNREYLTDPPKEGPAGGSARNNTYSVDPNLPTRKRYSDDSNIEYVSPGAESEETPSQYSRRLANNDYPKKQRHRSRRMRVLIAFIVVVLALMIAAFVAWNVYIQTTNTQISAGVDENLTGALTTVSDSSSAYYVLLVGVDKAETGDGEVVTSIMLARIDTQAPLMTLVSIPAATDVYLTNYGYEQICTAHAYGGPKLLIRAVEDLTGVSVNHYIQYDVQSCVSLVDELGGVKFDVPSNTQYGGLNVPAGNQNLTSQQALTCYRCYKTYSTGYQQLMSNQRSIMLGILTGFSKASTFKRIQLLSSVATNVTTDMDVLDIIGVANSFKAHLDDNSYYSCAIPTTEETYGDTTSVEVDSDRLKTMMNDVEQGDDPQANTAETTSDAEVVPSEYKITVKNGSGVAGCATQAADLLSSAGFGIESTGNANMFVYDETLVVYGTGSQKALAEYVVSTLGVGRAVQNLGSYTYDGDLLVVVGKDWKPIE